MKTKYTMFRRGEMFYIQDSATGKQTSLKTKDETEARSLLNPKPKLTGIIGVGSSAVLGHFPASLESHERKKECKGRLTFVKDALQCCRYE
jgi:hypothetical protein